MRMLLKVFLRWRLGAAKAEKLAGWLDTRPQPKTPDYLKEAEVEQLYQDCRTTAQKFLIAVLFDAGTRAEEFHNIRLEDIHLPEGKENFVKITLRAEYSKTLGRTIALYWPQSQKAVKKFRAERIAAGIKPSDPMFEGSYDSTKKFLKRLGMRVLKRPVHYHLFRHSSATYYATQLNRQELCYRYGWRFSSNMPDTYISRAGMESKALDEKFTQTELSALKSELTKVQQDSKINEERLMQRIRQMEDSLLLLQTNHEAFSSALRENPSLRTVAFALHRKQRLSPGRNMLDHL